MMMQKGTYSGQFRRTDGGRWFCFILLFLLLLWMSAPAAVSAASEDQVIASWLSGSEIQISLDESQYYGIIDPDHVMSGSYSDEDLQELNDSLKQTAEDTNTATYMYVTTETGMYEGYEDYIQSLYEQIPFEDSVILFVGYNQKDNVFRIDAYGSKASRYLSNARCEKIENAMDASMRSHDFTGAAKIFSTQAGKLLKMNPVLDLFIFRWYVQLPVILLIVALLILLRVRSVGVRETVTEATYRDPDSSKVIGAFDRFSYMTTTKVRNASDSDHRGGGGGGGGGGGHSHGSGHSF